MSATINSASIDEAKFAPSRWTESVRIYINKEENNLFELVCWSKHEYFLNLINSIFYVHIYSISYKI